MDRPDNLSGSKNTASEDTRHLANPCVLVIFGIAGDFSDSKVYVILKKKFDALAKQKASTNCIFYFAAPTQSMETIAIELGKASLLKEENNNFRHIVVEKPFGHDLASEKKLNQVLLSVVDELLLRDGRTWLL